MKKKKNTQSNSLFLPFILYCYLFQVHLEKILKYGEWNPFIPIAGFRTVLDTLLMVRGYWNAVLSFCCWCAERNGWDFKLFVGAGTVELVWISPLLVSMVKWKTKCAKWEQCISSHSLCIDLYTWWVFLEEVSAPSACNTLYSHKKGGQSMAMGLLSPVVI